MEQSTYRTGRTDIVPGGMKRCTRCEVDWIADAEHFPRNAGRSDGLDPWCKTCVSLRSKRYQQMTGKLATHRMKVDEEKTLTFIEREQQSLREWRERVDWDQHFANIRAHARKASA
jgi:hypothetical protein